MKSPLGAYRDAIFFASGFAGLIYESIWTHYLKLFLGHAAYAQTLVLAIFMGGMAIGAAVVARSTDRIESPLRVYAIVEAAIGVLAFAFHPLFVLTTQGFYNVAFDTQWSGAFFTAAKWALAAMLILPQSILLGATFPLFSSAAARDAPADQGHSIATLYFANSAGGALGVLAAGFLLVPEVGLFGTIASAGVLNLAIAAIVIASWNTKASRAVDPVEPPKPAASKRKRQREASQAVSRRGSASDRIAGFSNARGREAAKAAAQSDPVPLASDKLVLRLVSAVCLLTGASSFIYEIGWIRMLSLVLGSATHSFELMLSSFVLGLALGGFWIRTRIDGVVNRGLRLGYVQIAMGCAALATVPLYSMSFNIVAAALSVLPRTDGGYTLFNVMRYGVASLIMFPAAFCAGMTLPLATRILYSMKEKGERAIGYVYSVNTVGAIVGLAFAVHVGMPLLGLEYLVGFGGVIDVLLGAALFVVFGSRRNRTFAYAAVLGSTVAMFAVAQTVDPQKLASSVFRIGRASTPGTVLEVAHGKTATITVERRQLGRQDLISIKTNGKPDAAANMNPRANFVPDQLTTALLGAVPLLIHDAPREIANIGFGSGLTGAVLLTDPRVLHLDTIEIEPRMVDLARHFDPLNRNVYTDPRSAIRIEDAKSFFAANGKRYDVIVSEPSNPWVSGVSGLFSVDFYRHVARYLNDDGLFAQWLQAYETHPDRIVSVLKAMDEAFDDYAVVALNEIDVLLIGKRHGKLTLPADAYPGLSAATREALRAVDVVNQADITLRIAGNKALFRPWLDSRPIAANSDFMPYLDSYSDRDRFFNRAWREFVDVALSPVPVAEILGGRPPLPTPSALTISPQLGPEPQWVAARMAWEALFGPMRNANAFAVPINMPANMADEAKAILDGCANASVADSASAIARVATRILPYLSPAEGRDILGSLQNAACFTNLTGAQAQWPLLLHAVVERDAQNFGRIADALLSAGQGATSAGMRYLLGMAMLGHIRAGNRQRASELWTQFARRALGDQPPGLPLYLLYAHAVAGGRQ